MNETIKYKGIAVVKLEYDALKEIEEKTGDEPEFMTEIIASSNSIFRLWKLRIFSPCRSLNNSKRSTLSSLTFLI
ncbi:MAG: hypothetical protein GWO20_20690 [Candidatus Korarchaeota archaeon]|nr:hypothetical protein [Candidatus Korarchaeota archaeon]NIU85643.1 hypothetical protein [Candidatus Thorarchaeota archaeon]NIW12955.1 hypothetical protein [Candidatus Thorarchaeota archaeon]NIW51100.1 hypothetical protein [Candidatus Korarchaeota archaeon]